jgi:hypothetical protein
MYVIYRFDLELMVCGNPEVDIEVLRKHTVYNSIPATSSLVKYFWQTMESFNTEERQMFLRFVWGRRYSFTTYIHNINYC